MAFSIFNKPLPLPLMLISISIYTFGLGRSQPGIAGTGTGYLPLPGGGVRGGGIGVGFISRALDCLSDKVYSECAESYRLTQSGDLNVPPEYTDQYCSGACLKETNLVLNCISDIMSNFFFYNRATVRDVKDTIKAGCSYGPTRGNFNVAEHIQAYGSNSNKFSYSMSFVLVPLISICILYF